jgi:phosphocarrier protein HPr
MKEFQYTIKDSCGIHARPAGLLAKMAKNYGGTAKLSCNGKDCEIKKLMALMSMGVKQGETVTVSVEGEGDAAFAAELEKFFKENL